MCGGWGRGEGTRHWALGIRKGEEEGIGDRASGTVGKAGTAKAAGREGCKSVMGLVERRAMQGGASVDAPREFKRVVGELSHVVEELTRIAITKCAFQRALCASTGSGSSCDTRPSVILSLRSGLVIVRTK